MPRKNCPPLCLFAFLATVTLACVPLASATSINIDSRLDARSPKVDTSALVPVAMCHIGAKIYSLETWDGDASAMNTLLPQCGNATNIGMLSQLLAMLNGGAISGGVNEIATGIAAGVNLGSTAVVGSLCGTTSACLASATPVSTSPEPATLPLLATGLLGLAELVRRRTKTSGSGSRFSS